MAPDTNSRQQLTACDWCETAFELDVSYPVITCEDDCGDLQLYSFCDDTCRRSWEDGNL